MSTVVIVVAVLMMFVVVPPVAEALMATFARLVELMSIVIGLLAVHAVPVDVVLQTILPSVDVVPAGRDIVIIRVHDWRGSE